MEKSRECDFILKRGKELIPIQVTYEPDESNLERETEGLAAAMKKLNQPRGYPSPMTGKTPCLRA